MLEQSGVTKLDVYRSMATFTLNDTKNYKVLTDVKVPVESVTVNVKTVSAAAVGRSLHRRSPERKLR